MEMVLNSPVLDEHKHRRLIADIKRVARDGGVTPRALATPMSEVCSEAEIEWLRDLRKHMAEGVAGLVMTGRPERIEERMSAIAAACIRNFVDARVMSLQEVLSRLKKDDMPDCTVLLVPNFHVAADQGGLIAKWEHSPLLGLLVDRYSSGLITILYVSSMPVLGKEYGGMMREHLTNYFDKLET